MNRQTSAGAKVGSRIRHAARRLARAASACARLCWPRSRAGRVAAATCLALVMVGAAGYAALALRLSQGPIPLAFLNERVENSLQALAPDGMRLDISGTVLERDPRTGRLQIALVDVAVVGSDDSAVIAAPRAALQLSPGRLLGGRLDLRSVWLIEPHVTVNGAGMLLTGATLPGGDSPVAVFGGALALFHEQSGLSEIGVRNGRISVIEPEGGERMLEGISISAVKRRHQEGFRFGAQIGQGIGAPRLSGSLGRAEDGDFEVSVRVENLAPSDLGPLAPDGLADVFTSTVTSDLALRISDAGMMEAVSAKVRVGAGHVGTGRMSVLIDEADLALEWNRGSRRIEIKPSMVLAGYNRGSFSGEITIPQPDEFDYGTVPVRLELTDVSFGDPAGGRAAIYPSVSLEALYIRRQGLMHVSRLDVVAADAAMSFVGIVGGSGGESPAVRLAGSMLPVPFAAFRDLWPPFLGPLTRKWVIDHLSAGEITDARLTVDIPPGAIAASLRGVPLPESAFLLEFGLDDVEFGYLGDMPPVSGARGRAELTPGTFELRMEPGAQVLLGPDEWIAVGAGRFRIADRRAEPAIGEISFELSGAVPALLRLFDHPPLDIAKRREIDPAKFSGLGDLAVDIAVPLLKHVEFSDVALRIEGNIEDLAATDFHGARQVTDGRVVIKVDDGRVSLTGEGLLDGVPAEIAVDEPLNGFGQVGATSLTMTLDGAARERLGIRLGDVLTGPVTATVSDVRPTASGTTQKIEADLTAARIDVPHLGLEKPAGEPASASFLLTQEGGRVALSELSIQSGAIRVSGEAEFSRDGDVRRLNLPIVRTARGTDVSISGRMEGGETIIAVRGDALDLRNGLRSLKSAATGGPAGGGASDGGGVRIEVDVASVQGLHGQSLSNVSANVVRRRGEIVRFALTGTTAGGAPAAVRYVDEGGTAQLSAETMDAGRLLAWGGIYANMRSGRLNLAAARGGPEAPLAGQIVIQGFAIADDPSLARLIASGERDVRGQVDPSASVHGNRSVNPGNVGFDTLAIPFQRTGRGIRISDGVLRGTAVGATLEGDIDLQNESLSLRGTYVPLYEINNLFGQLPLVGPLLGGRRNEGLLGITYSLAGTLDQPVLTVNPLSVVAPGVFRYILGMDNPRAFAAPQQRGLDIR